MNVVEYKDLFIVKTASQHFKKFIIRGNNDSKVVSKALQVTTSLLYVFMCVGLSAVCMTLKKL